MASRLKAPTSNGSVVAEPVGQPIGGSSYGDFIFSIASVADELPTFGTSVFARDQKLREFWPTETFTASAMYSMVAKYASLQWSLEGPPRTVGIFQDMLNGVENGEGWLIMWMKALNDLFSTDNGGFIEVVRASDSPDAPCVTMNHLDSGRCLRTGHKLTPVLYYDIQGVAHLLKWYQVIPMTEFPSPNMFHRGIQLCAISRLLRAAQTMRDISIYKREKVSGRFNRAMYFVSGIQQRTIDSMLADQDLKANQDGVTRYIHPLVIAGLDPNAKVAVDVINFASLPEGFNEEVAMKWYISQLALAFGGDYQDFAPLPTGNLGSSSGQSATLHSKSLGKGIKLYMSMITQIMNYRGIMPKNVRFMYAERDLSEDAVRASMKLDRAKERQIRIMSGELTIPIARQIAADAGDLEYEYMMQMNAESTSSDIEMAQDNPLSTSPELLKVGDDSAYTGDPTTDTVPGANSWGAGTVNGGDTSGANGHAASPNKLPAATKPKVQVPKANGKS